VLTADVEAENEAEAEADAELGAIDDISILSLTAAAEDSAIAFCRPFSPVCVPLALSGKS